MAEIKANRPTAKGGRTYHLNTRPGSLSELCLLVGSPERATMIAKQLLTGARLVGNHRGLKSYTGEFKGVRMSVVTTGMGSASIGIVLPEAVTSGARIFIRVGSCGTLQAEPKVGDSVICTGAVRLDGASENWAPIQYPAVADYRVVAALVKAANNLGLPHHVGIGATTTCFNEGQARPDINDYIPPRLLALHEELTQRGVLFYSMEEATLFVWCTTHGKQFLAGDVNAIYANRVTNAFNVIGDEQAALIALNALIILQGV
jgi:uridine phosphorylase